MNTTECDAVIDLVTAVKALIAAKSTTRNGAVDDHCDNALREIRAAITSAVEFGETE
jgi:hypothetical protein